MVDFEAALRSSLAGYAIESEIGTGAMAVVFLAHDLKHDRNVAIKVLRPELTSAIGADRFNREIEVVAGLTHPHILPLHDSGDVDGLLYYVMPYIAGGSLRDRLARDGRLPIPDATRITREIADALGFAHRRGVIHRDVKPGNILLAEGHALLADFGIAHLAETEGGTLTGTGLTLGTPTYFSPEQATGEHDIDGRSDIYSLGCVLYETLTGEPPFTGPSVQALIAHHIVDEPPRAKQLRPDVSDGIEAVVQTALRKEPENRFQTAGEMAGSLDLVSGGFEVMAARALRKLLGPRYRWLHGWRVATLVAAVLAFVAAAILLSVVLPTSTSGPARTTFIVLPYEGIELTEDEKRLSAEAAKELYWHLGDWESVEVIPNHVVEGRTVRVLRAGFEGPRVSLDAGLELLSTLNATHLIYVQARAAGESISLEASISALNSSETEAIRGEGLRTEIEQITAGMALQILDVQGEAAEFGDLVRLSPIHQAHQEFREGRDALEDWRLSEAQERFGNAIELDSTFALAHYQLALTMYWRTIRDPERITTGEVIQYHVRRADIFGDSTRLRPGHRRDLDAFGAFWEGDYETARDRYAAILEEEGTNLDALVQAGAVELEDPWLAAGPDDEFSGPRGDLNRARAMFDSAVFLTPHVQLAWGGLFEIDREVARVALGGRCFGFVPPGGARIPPYVLPEAAKVLTYCPYVLDGAIYWSPDSLPAALHERVAREATALRDSTVGRLNFWADVESDQARPHEELAEWMLWERTTRRCEADPTWADSLLAAARRHTERALSIRGDTTPEDLIRLGSLLLATGDTPRATDHTDRALRALGDWQDGRGPPPPKSAANVYLAVGRGQTAAEILEAVDNEATWSVDDSTVDLGAIPGGPVLGTLQALGALGMTGDDDPGIASRFLRLERTWEGLGYSERQQALLRWETTSMVSPALLRRPAQRKNWFAGWHEYGLKVPPVWAGLMVAETNPEEAREHLDRAILEDSTRRPGWRRAFDYYLPIQLAERLGEDSIAAALAERSSRCPPRLDNFDFGWGMR